LRCYAPRTSVIIALLILGYLALRHSAGHALAHIGVVTNLVIILGACLLAAGIITVSAVAIRRRRAAAGACLACRHPCQDGLAEPAPAAGGGRDAAGPPVPVWPHLPLTRAAVQPGVGRPAPANRSTLPVVVIPASAAQPAGRAREQATR
jgi:hypothetical protein